MASFYYSVHCWVTNELTIFVSFVTWVINSFHVIYSEKPSPYLEMMKWTAHTCGFSACMWSKVAFKERVYGATVLQHDSEIEVHSIFRNSDYIVWLKVMWSSCRNHNNLLISANPRDPANSCALLLVWHLITLVSRGVSNSKLYVIGLVACAYVSSSSHRASGR